MSNEIKSNEIKEDAKIQIDDLEQVAGGTLTEYKELIKEKRFTDKDKLMAYVHNL